MGKRLVITEKPSVARDIAAALGGFTEYEEYLESEDFVVTYAVGHLLELAEPQEYDKKYASWAIKNLPIIPEVFQIQPKEGQKKRLDHIKKLGHRKDIDGLINACDAGREGELIFRRISEYSGFDGMKQQRLWLQSMTKDAIRTAFTHLRPGHDLDSLGDAAFCRAVGDWMVGMNATRALTQRLKSRGEQEAWSAGRVQTPTLYLIVRREREILAHVPRPYWEIVGSFAHGAQTWDARYWDPEQKPAKSDEEEGDAEAKPSRLFDRARVDFLMAELAKAKIGDASEKRKKSKQNPPLPFDLTALQREANRRFSFSAKRTLDAAQRLYEQHKLLTYPRTDSRYLPEDYGPTVDTILKSLERSNDWKGLCKGIAAAGPQNLDKLLDSTKVSDHFAIVPTGNLPEGELRGDDERVFEIVVRQFLAALMGPATWATVERLVEFPLPVDAAKKTDIARFRVTGRTLEDPGFHLALGTPQSESMLPPLVPGNDTPSGVKANLTGVVEEAKDTRPPSRYSEASLLRMMETAGQLIDDEELSDAMKGRGLGTPATRADTIEGLVRKSYARRVDGKLGATSKAMRLMDILERAKVGALADPRMTGEWEHALVEVQAGRLKRSEMLGRLQTFTKDVVEVLAHFDHATLYTGDADLGVCPSCHEGKVIETSWGYRCSLNVDKASPCDFIIWKDRAGRYIDRDTAARLVRDGKVGPISGFVDRGGRALEGTLTLERDAEKENRWALKLDYGDGSNTESGPEIVGVAICACPEHPGCQIIETSRRYVCKKLLEHEVKTGPVLPKQVCHREIALEEAQAFFGDAAKTEILEAFISKRGRPFKGALVRKETGKHGFEFPPRPGAVPGEEPRRGGRRPVGKGKAADVAPSTAKKPAKKATKKPAKKAAAASAAVVVAEAPKAKKPASAAKKSATAAKKPATAAKEPATAATTATKKPAAAAKKPATAATTATKKPAAAAKKPATAATTATKKPAAAAKPAPAATTATKKPAAAAKKPATAAKKKPATVKKAKAKPDAA